MSAQSEFRELFLIYCLERQPDGRYIALNRRYKPVGLVTAQRVECEAFPVSFKFKRALSERQVAALSWSGDTAFERIYLYNDGCVPTRSAADWSAYSARLQRLAGYGVVC